VAVDCYRDGNDSARDDIAEFRSGSTVNGSGGKVEQKVEDTDGCIHPAQQPAVQLFELRPHAG
jgi:hypothetical protein